jgi:hypothetical protein
LTARATPLRPPASTARLTALRSHDDISGDPAGGGLGFLDLDGTDHGDTGGRRPAEWRMRPKRGGWCVSDVLLFDFGCRAGPAGGELHHFLSGFSLILLVKVSSHTVDYWLFLPFSRLACSLKHLFKSNSNALCSKTNSNALFSIFGT